MRGNWIRMSATAAAANGNPTALTAVANYPSFADVFGSAATVSVDYDMDDGAGHKEEGVGVVDLANLSMQRYPYTTYDASASPKYVAVGAAPLADFSAPVSVLCGLAAANFSARPGPVFKVGGSAPAVIGCGNGFFSSGGNGASFAMAAETAYFVPFRWEGRFPIRRATMMVNTSGTSPCPIRLALYAQRPDQVSADLLVEFTAATQFDGTNAAVQSLTAPSDFPAIMVPPGDYFLGTGCSGVNGCSVEAEADMWLQSMGAMLGYQAGQIQSANGMFQLAGSFNAAFPAQLTSSNTTGLIYAYSHTICVVFGDE